MGRADKDAVRETFAPLHARVRELGKNEGRDTEPRAAIAGDRHWMIVDDPDLSLVSEIARLAHEGIEKVRALDPYFRENPLYDDGNFWYDLCLLAIAVAKGRINSTVQAPIPTQVAEHVYGSLLELVGYTARRSGDDMSKRNLEALAFWLRAFPYQPLLDRSERTLSNTPDERGQGMLRHCIKLAREDVRPEPIGSRGYGLSTLKGTRREDREVGATRMVVCPVVGCGVEVPRRTRKEKLQTSRFLCPYHQIYISPSTYVHAHEQDNLLWVDGASKRLLGKVMKEKRESRMGHERSEDAVTWNIFRFLDMNGLLPALVAHWIGWPTSSASIAYWSSIADSGSQPHPLLVAARGEFGEQAPNFSEPDLILETPDCLLFLEAKLTSANRTGREVDSAKVQRYATGAKEWSKTALKTSCEDMAAGSNLYQLMRLWLLGSWAAKREGKRFALINLVPDRAETDIEMAVAQHVAADERRSFSRQTWEGIYRWVERTEPRPEQARSLLYYMEEKTVGYANGRIGPAFDLR